MKVLIIGSGSREHALAWHFRTDPRVQELFCAPGNAGTAQLGTNLPIAASDLAGLAAWAEHEKPDLTFVGPEVPLCAGVGDAFRAMNLRLFGPDRQGAQLEASKIFTKEFLLKYQIPTGAAQAFSSSQAALAYSRTQPYPQVIKADGLAAGKGVIIAGSAQEAEQAIENLMDKKIFGDSGARILIEECLTGQEVSIMIITDGDSFQVLPPVQDHKRLLDHDAGPNTGGMGAYAPAPFYDPELAEIISRTILSPTLKALKQERINYEGILYAGLMLTPVGPRVIEFNVRLGDPEAQVILPLLKTPLLDIAAAVAEKRLASLRIDYHRGHAVGVVLAAENYPESPRLGDVIEGLSLAGELEDTFLFHGGTTFRNDKVVTSGGRVLTAVSWSDDLLTARNQAYRAVDLISFQGSQHRCDIGARSLPPR